MKVLPDDIDNRPETRSNPYDGVGFENECIAYAKGQQCILNQCVEVDIHLMAIDLCDIEAGQKIECVEASITKFIQEQMNLSNKSNSSQEVKDGKQ